MSNILPVEKQGVVIGALAEGTSIRSIERMTGVHRDTIMRLGVRIGKTCGQMMDEKMRNLTCRHIQVDEIWGFIGKKQRIVTPEEEAAGLGDVWTFVAMDPETKIVPCFVAGKRDYQHTYQFISDLAGRMANRIQLSTDGMNEYMATVDDVFGDRIDYGQIVKIFSSPPEGQRRYSPPIVTAVTKKLMAGEPDMDLVSTSHVERQNLTMRMHMRRLTRLTNAFSKKLENFRAAVALHFAYYNFVKVHSSLRMTPAMAAGVASSLWKVEDLIELS